MTFRREHVRIFSSLQDALRAGFRPCRRYRPGHESSVPNTPPGSSSSE
ncbi:Ada metal-binding domain-containing protein [Kyrpidia spormannii]